MRFGDIGNWRTEHQSVKLNAANKAGATGQVFQRSRLLRNRETCGRAVLADWGHLSRAHLGLISITCS